MADDDFDKKLASQIQSNREKLELLEGKFEHLTRQSFADHQRANKLIEEMSADQGESAVYHALRLEPHAFGELPESRAAASTAEEKRPELAVVFDDYRRLRDATDELLMTQQMRAKAKELTPDPGAGGTPAAESRQARREYMKQWKQIASTKAGGKTSQVEAEPEPGD